MVLDALLKIKNEQVRCAALNLVTYSDCYVTV
jgi:hypothetical protein